MNPSYRRVSSPDDSLHTPSSSHASTAAHPNYAERLADKFFAAIWVGLAVAVGRWCHVWSVLTAPDTLANHTLLQVAASLLGLNTALLAYLTLYLPICKGLSDSTAWSIYCPRVIPTMTATGVAIAVLLIRATWPVWGFLAPLILAVEALGLLYSLHFVPWWCR